MTGNTLCLQNMNEYRTGVFTERKSKSKAKIASKNKDSRKQRYFCLPGQDETTLTELLLITQYRFFRG